MGKLGIFEDNIFRLRAAAGSLISLLSVITQPMGQKPISVLFNDVVDMSILSLNLYFKGMLWLVIN